jgi:hypothetical protein
VLVCLTRVQYVEFAGADMDPGDDWVVGAGSGDGLADAEIQVNSLEALLAAKNKRLQDELAKFRVSEKPYSFELIPTRM